MCKEIGGKWIFKYTICSSLTNNIKDAELKRIPFKYTICSSLTEMLEGDYFDLDKFKYTICSSLTSEKIGNFTNINSEFSLKYPYFLKSFPSESFFSQIFKLLIYQ